MYDCTTVRRKKTNKLNKTNFWLILLQIYRTKVRLFLAVSLAIILATKLRSIAHLNDPNPLPNSNGTSTESKKTFLTSVLTCSTETDTTIT